MKTSSDVIDAINALERSFPVGSWCAGDIALWPVYRMRLYIGAVDGLLLSREAPNTLARLESLARRAGRSLLRVPLAAWRDRGANAQVSPGTAAVFFSDGLSFLRLADAWFDRVVDPVMQALKERGLRSLKLTPLSEAHVPRHWPSRLVQPAIDCVKLIAPYRRPILDLPQFDTLVAAARTMFETSVPSRDWLQTQAARLDALAHWFTPVLRRSEAGHAFVNNWYSLEGQAFVLAARRLGLRTIDLQHGMQGKQHVAYARWLAVPAQGYSTMPDEFWVWGADEAAAIAAWSSSAPTHRARVIGNYWLERWRIDADPLVARYLAEARVLRGVASTQVLVGLTWGVTDVETEKLIEAARLCHPAVAWWWRLHPVDSARRTELAVRLERAGLDGSRVGATTDLPLYALLRCADVTVAHSSTLVQEAAQFGLRSVVTSEYGAALHAGLVRQGVALHANDPAEIAAAVRTLAAQPRMAQGGQDRVESGLDKALDELLRTTPSSSGV
jgi:hypothetical protein